MLVMAGFGWSVRAADPPAPVGAKIAELSLPDTAIARDWKIQDQAKDAKGTVVVFLASGCPASVAYIPKLSEMSRKYEEKGISFVAVFSHPLDDTDAIRKFATETALSFPALWDQGGAVAKKFAVERVPSVAVLDASRTVRYAGRIDDQFAPNAHKPKAETSELATAVSRLVDGQEIVVKHTVAAGCLLPKDKGTPKTTTKLTYHRDIVPILQARCTECHRAGEAGPFSLTEYKSAKGWADMMAEVVENGTMPPWHADAKPGHFANDRRMTAEEKAKLLEWIAGGCVEGNPADAPAPRKYVQGWRLPKEPDVVLKMKKATPIPAQSFLNLGMPYQYVEVGEPLKEDIWVTGVEVRPEYRAVVHHIIAFIIPPGGSFMDIAGEDFGSHMLGAYVPGDQPIILPPGHARKLAKGSRIMFELHYTPNGKAGSDTSMVGFTTTTEKPQWEVFNASIMNGRFRIPPGDPQHVVKAKYTFPEDVELMSFTPHMHLRGKAFKYELAGSAQPEVLCNVPKYDFNWQVSYDLAEYRKLPKGSTVECTAVFDNSTGNPFNPDATKRVRWGQQTWDEMMIGFVMYRVKR
jgi:thiol-disulfide isomerase/thioredoxin